MSPSKRWSSSCSLARGINLHAVCGRGNNAYIYALAGDLQAADGETRPSLAAAGQGPSRAVVQRLQRAGARWPGQPELASAPGYFRLSDLPADCADLFGSLTAQNTPLGRFVWAQEQALALALSHIDLGAQPHKPWLEREAQETFRPGLLLLLNRLIGTEKSALSLYSTEEWRSVSLAEAVQAQVTRLRRAEQDAGYRENTPAVRREVRILNRMLLEHLYPALAPAKRRAAQASADTQAAAPPAAFEANTYVRPPWVTARFTQEERATLPDKSLTELQDIIHEIYAAAGKRYKDPKLYETYHRQRGYAG